MMHAWDLQPIASTAIDFHARHFDYSYTPLLTHHLRRADTTSTRLKGTWPPSMIRSYSEATYIHSMIASAFDMVTVRLCTTIAFSLTEHT